VVRPDGSLYGCNNDGFGYLKASASASWTGVPMPARSCSAAAAAPGGGRCAADAAPEIRLVNRMPIAPSRWRLNMAAPCAVDWSRRAEIRRCRHAVNTTTQGMTGCRLDLALDRLPVAALVSTSSILPETPLAVTGARQLTVNGLGMLINQVRPAPGLVRHSARRDPWLRARLEARSDEPPEIPPPPPSISI
jgi:shikimate 5-dehydrogenase